MLDLFIIGGGINGCGIARDAVGRGYTVGLAEQNDIGSATSSGSSKLIHGGLRYLEHYAFRLVKEALNERDVLISIAPHLIRPMRFLLIHRRDLRPAFLIRLGLLLYDNLGSSKYFQGTQTKDLSLYPEGETLAENYRTGFEYSDAFVDDARLVIANALSAKEKGATIFPRTKAIKADRVDDHWQIELIDSKSIKKSIKAKLLINASGPWVNNVIEGALPEEYPHNKVTVRLVKGSHILIKTNDKTLNNALVLQNADKRIIFVIPYQNDYSLIGTTEEDYEGKAEDVKISTKEINYLLESVNQYFKTPVSEKDILWDYSAIRPLYDDGKGTVSAQKLSRDYMIKVEGKGEEAKVVNIYGGKITTYRKLAETVLTKIAPYTNKTTQSWTGSEALPGGDFPVDGLDELTKTIMHRFSFLTEKQALAIAQRHGTNVFKILHQDSGRHFGSGLYEAEVDFLRTHEWAQTCDDIIWRRTKTGLHLSEQQRSELEKYMTNA